MKSIAPTPEFVMLAPMEGIIDYHMRGLFSAIGGIDRCVTEFIRVTRCQLPDRVYRRYFPEIDTNSETLAATPVYAQLLGDNPSAMADNAARLAEMGAKGIDINFGCPAKTVNNHGGGSVLLQSPEKLHGIVSSIRKAVPESIPVTAKIRLGYQDKSLMLENVTAIETGGADELAVHARTKIEGYKPPAHWHYIAQIIESIDIPVIANGEMWTLADMHKCQNTANTSRIMLGRGLVACPDLALLSKEPDYTPAQWGDVCVLLLYYMETIKATTPEKYQNNLVKQWLVYLRERYAGAFLFFEAIKRLRQPDELEQALRDEIRRESKKSELSGHIGRLNLSNLLGTCA